MRTPASDEHIWERGWDEHERMQMLRLARLPLPEKLAWLEEISQVAEHLRRSRTRRAKRDQVDITDPKRERRD